MTFFSRKSPRIPKFDYSSSGYYFVTICTYNKNCIFGTTEKLSNFGIIARNDLYAIEKHFDYVRIDRCVIMPNHIHAIIVLEKSFISNLNLIVGQYKSGVTRKIREIAPDTQVWQRSYHDHIIRNEKQYQKIWEYIDTNPLRWKEDCFYQNN